MAKAFKPIDHRNISPRQFGTMVRRVTSTYDQASPAMKEEGKTWYPRAHDEATTIGHGDNSKGAGMIAALSPSTGWDENMDQAHYMGKHGLPGAHVLMPLHEQYKHLDREAKSFRGNNPKGTPLPDSLSHDLSQNRNAINRYRTEHLEGTPLNMNYTDSLVRAHMIQTGGKPEDHLNMPVKTGNFYTNIHDPSNAHAVTIDRHAHDLSVGDARLGSADRGLATKGRYNKFADAYRTAAHRLDVVPHEAQAVTWSQWRHHHGID